MDAYFLISIVYQLPNRPVRVKFFMHGMRTEAKIKEENNIVGCNSATPEVVSDSCKAAAQPSTTFVYRKDNTAAAPPPSAAAMMYSYAPPSDAVSYNPLVKSPCFTNPDRSTSGYSPVYGDDVANRMYFSSSVTSSITSLADAYLMQAALPHLHQHHHQQQQQQQGQGQRTIYNSSLTGSSNLKAEDPDQFTPILVGTAGGRDPGVNGSSGHLQISQPLISAQLQPGVVEPSSSVHHFLPSITEFGSVARHSSYC